MNQMRMYLLHTDSFLTDRLSPEELVEYEEERAYNQALVIKQRQRELAAQASRVTDTRKQWLTTRFSNWLRLSTTQTQLTNDQENTKLSSASIESTFIQAVDHNQFSSAQQHKPIQIYDWLRQEFARLQTEPDRRLHPWIRGLIEELMLDRKKAGLYWLTDFPGTSYLNMQLMDLHTLLPDSYHRRIRQIIGEVGSNDVIDALFGRDRQALPAGETTPFEILNDLMPRWTFFTQHEVRAIQTATLAFIDAAPQTYWYKEEWRTILTAHEHYDYDWLAFYNMF